MTIREVPEFPICSNCKSGQFKTLEMKYTDIHSDILGCKKCGSVTDYGLLQKEDYKHKIYHENGEPDDAPHIGDNVKPKHPPPDDNVNIVKKPQTQSVETNKNEVPKIYS